MVQKRNYRKEYLTYDGLPKRKKARASPEEEQDML